MCCGLLALGFTLGVAPASVRADELSDIRALATGGDLAGAIKRNEKALEAKPRDAQLRFQHGVLLMDAGRDAAALAVFTQMSQDYPELPDPYNNVALLHARAGRLEAALSATQDALRVEPSHRTARANLGLLHLMLAVQTWDALARSGPVEPLLQRKLEGARALLGPVSPASPR